MKKRTFVLLLTIVLSLVISACSNSSNSSNSKEAAIQATASAKEMVDQMFEQIEQPMLMELDPEMIENLYHLDAALFEEYTIRTPLMNVQTNEIAIVKVKDAKDIATVEAAIKQRATDVQKQFETYLPDQYENAKNYKLVTKGNYILFVISDKADELVKAYDSFFEQK
ncbi:DUF4358 domain-containing protein [Cohnella sp. WQ 127256]|uniref:DUF4358 domain-containing protein n=1 Tax=Cohnella sp. WQ 127256 TaxID=2938790 RepID=UPI002117B52B|nr:DUF4358 domain-containing protein [Cohnella sp. WQ 127256]